MHRQRAHCSVDTLPMPDYNPPLCHAAPPHRTRQWTHCATGLAHVSLVRSDSTHSLYLHLGLRKSLRARRERARWARDLDRHPCRASRYGYHAAPGPLRARTRPAAAARRPGKGPAPDAANRSQGLAPVSRGGMGRGAGSSGRAPGRTPPAWRNLRHPARHGHRLDLRSGPERGRSFSPLFLVSGSGD